MPKFYYVGTRLDGDVTEGYLSAPDASNLELRLATQGIALANYRPGIGLLQRLRLILTGRGEVTRVTRQIHILLESGITVLEALSLAIDQLKDATLRQVFTYTIRQVESGQTLADTLKEYPTIFDDLYSSMIAAGEVSGDLGQAFDRVATYREKGEGMSKKVKSALAYPALVTLVAMLVVFVLVFYVVPIFSSMYENFGAELPELTANVVAATTFIRETIAWWLGGLLVLVAGIIASSRSDKVVYLTHRLLLQIPGLKTLLTRILAARFARTMGALLMSGVEIVYALNIAIETTGNAYAKSRLRPVESLLTQGTGLTESLEEARLLPAAMLRMTASGEKTGRLGEMLTRAADYYERETDTTINTLTSLIEPMVILILGAAIAFILVAMYLPLFDLVGAM